MFFSFLPFGIHIHTMNNLKQYKIVGMLSNQQLLQANARRNDDNPLTVKSVGGPDIIGHPWRLVRVNAFLGRLKTLCFLLLSLSLTFQDASNAVMSV